VALIELRTSALAPGVSPVQIHYRDVGSGSPIVILHGGWGYEVYPFDRQIVALEPNHRIVIPDRTGYGGSGRLERQEIDFHRRAADETLAVIDALGLERPVVWGHSDGAVVALLMALAAPERIGGVIAEAAHFFRNKPSSRAFFDAMMADPDGLGERVVAVFMREHGSGWRDVIRNNGAVWRRLADERRTPDEDLYGGRLSGLRVPALLIHGARDPRTEPAELDALRAALGVTDVGADRGRPEGGASSAPTIGPEGRASSATTIRFAVLAEGGHSPHSERATADEVTRLADAFIRGTRLEASPPVAQPPLHGSGEPRPSSPDDRASGGGGFSPATS
jgi:pimeloyl-ACP methyl ester carboxylesterase